MRGTTAVSERRFLVVGLALLLLVSLLALSPPTPVAEAAPPTGPDKLADFEAGLPSTWFTFFGGSTVETLDVTVGDADALARPAQAGTNGLLEVTYAVSDFGGFGTEYATIAPQDWSLTDGFSFWFNGTGSGLAYQAEISDNRSDPGSDTSERFDYEFTDDSTGWRRIAIPWSDFTRATDFQPPGAPDDGLTLTEVWAWAIVLPNGSDTVHFDDFGLIGRVVDDFESGLPSGTDAGSGVSLGFFTFSDGSPVAIDNPATPPMPESFEFGTPNAGLDVTMNVGGFAGVIHTFGNEAMDTWTPQDWSEYEGFAFWLYGQSTGTDLFIDLIENRAPGSTSDDAERWSIALVDDFAGWRYFEIPFDDFFRKDIGNGAPNDGFTRQEMHGWAFGSLNTDGSEYTWYLDGIGLYGSAGSIPLTVAFSNGIFEVAEGTTGEVTVKLNRAMVDSDPDSVSVDFATEPSTAEEGRDYTPTSGTLVFTKGGPQAQSFTVETFDDGKFTGNLRIVLRLSNPVDVEIGFIRQASALIIDAGPYDPSLLDDFEDQPYRWHASDGVELSSVDVGAGDPMAVPGQGASEGILEAHTPILIDPVLPANFCKGGNGVLTVAVLSTDVLDATSIDHTTAMFGDASEAHVIRRTGEAQRHEEDFDGDGRMDLVFHFRLADTGYDCDTTDTLFRAETFDGQPVVSDGYAAFGRDFALGEDWTRSKALSFWYYGTGSGDEIDVILKDNRAPDPGPLGWETVWADEFDGPDGAAPDPANWGFEIGDVTPDGKNGWGNEERQYYTDDSANAALDGNGNLVITLREADGSLECYYGSCEYTSARLLTQDRKEFAYGRIEARLRVPTGSDGLWPAFWSLGTDIVRNPWPNAGEIDFMEYVSRLPNEIFGTIHGPGYAGGASFGNVYDFGTGVSDEFHTFTVEWQPDHIDWYVDDILYHTATPADVAPNEWVFDKPFFLLLNLAIGGNFGGSIDPGLELPQEYIVDYVRVDQAPDTAERFEASFVDDFEGWKQVTVPFGSFTRSADQPAGAPNDGLGLDDVWGYGFALPEGGTSTGTIFIDQVYRIDAPPPTSITVTNLDNSGIGSLRDAVGYVAEGGTITFDSSLAGGTIGLTTGPLWLTRDVTIDGSDAPGISLDGGGGDRVLIVDAGVDAAVSDLTMTNGYGYQLAGCVLNNGALSLDHVTVTGCEMTTDAGDFWQGGGGIYNGDGATLLLVDSTVSDNASGWAGGGVFSFFNTTTTVERSTISGNTAADVGGGFRTLGNMTVTNSTVSGNESTGWYGGAIFITDGVVDVLNSTVADNTSPVGAPADVFVGTFGESSATLTFVNSIVSSAQDNCFFAPWGPGAVTLTADHNNVFTDASCFAGTTDQIVADAGLGVLGANGGPTSTHALSPGSVAVDAADPGVCPATDQRGVARDAACDVGSFELLP